MNRIPHDTTKIFTEIFESQETFLEEWKSCGLYKSSLLKETSVKWLYCMLYAKYGNSAIANWDINQFKYKVYSIMFQYGPTWEKRLDIQERLRSLKEEELLKGSKAIYNQALNPSTEPTTSTLEEITTINAQNTTNFKKSVMEGYELLLGLLETDVSEEFLRRFKPLFATFVYTRPDIYVSEGE